MATCFVVQGFGEKTDFTNGRKLNLDASYQVIKEAVEAAGLQCIRSDEVVKTGMIDIPMYEWILKAELVIADLSTYNLNAAYELGVRYGVAPKATIIIAESEFKYPFDFSHLVVHPYRHLGEDVGRAEAIRFKAALTTLIGQVMAASKADSPLYELLAPLDPPVRRALAGAAASPAAAPSAVSPASGESAKAEREPARSAMKASRFVLAKEILAQVHADMLPNDPFVLQQLALATYKSKDPDPVTALNEAHQILEKKLLADTTNDPETLGLWGAVHKRLWERGGKQEDLDTAIRSYARGFFLKEDYYNGINLAFLFNVRAAEHQAAGRLAESVADFVLAQRIRREVIPLCKKALGAEGHSPSDRYWILATLWEAAHGLEDTDGVAVWQPQAEEAAKAAETPWMIADSTQPQLEKLSKLLAASPLKQLSLS